MRSRTLAAMMLIVLVAALGAGCARPSGTETPTQTSTQPPDQQPAQTAAPATEAPPAPPPLTKVRIGTLPYFDYTAFVAASALGLDKEQGLEFEFVPFSLETPAVQALIKGDIDIAQGAIGSFAPLLPQVPELRIVLNNNQFKGFMFIGRQGNIKTFAELREEATGDFARAQRETMGQFKGKTIVMVKSSFEGMLKAALEQSGLALKDVKILDFADDAKAAAAFLRGEGDLYTGSLPQVVRILKEPGYVNVAGNEVLGPAGIWFSNSAVTEQYLNQERATLLKVLAVYYRTMRYLVEKEGPTLGAMVEHLNKQAATNLTVEDAKNLRDTFVDFADIEGSLRRVYSPDSPLYWRKAAVHFIQQNEELGKITPGSVNIEQIVVQEQVFNELLRNKELIGWVQSPIQ